MRLEQMTRAALQTPQPDPELVRQIRRYMDRRPYLTAEEYEALRGLAQALRLRATGGEAAMEESLTG